MYANPSLHPSCGGKKTVWFLIENGRMVEIYDSEKYSTVNNLKLFA